jgi:hypothetical protein
MQRGQKTFHPKKAGQQQQQKRIERHSIAAAAQTAFLFLLEEPLAVPICVCMVMAPLCLKDFDLNIRQRVAAAAGRDRKSVSVKRHTLFGCCTARLFFEGENGILFGWG